MAYSDIDANKLVNKESLLQLCSIIKGELANAGSSYTFTNGLTESNGTVSWDLGSYIKKKTNKKAITFFVNYPDEYQLADYTISGYGATARGDNSIAWGLNTATHGAYSFACGLGIEALGASSADFGKYNEQDYYNKYVLVIGNGASAANRDDAMTIDWSGNEYLAGDLYIGCNDFTTTSNGPTTTGCGGSKVATEAYVNSAVANSGGGGGISLPTEPSNDGTYMLKCVVSSGTATYSWESVVVGGSY